MLYDLNIAWSPSTSSAQLQRTLKFASSLGYDVVALNHTVSAPIPSQVINPIPLLTAPPPSHPQPSPLPPSSSSSSSSSFPDKLPTTLRRATVVISDPATNHRLASFASAYDVVAARPTTEKAFSACCTTMAEFSLISLDLTASLPFHFAPRTSMAAVSRGIRFEICYAQALGAEDARARSNFIANLSGLVRATRGRGLVLSSETARPLDLRAPADVINLLAVWGLGTERGAEALAANPRAVVVNEGIKRRGFRGVVDVVRAAGGGPAGGKPGGDGDGDGKPGEKKKKTKGTDGGKGGGGHGRKQKEGKAGAKAGGDAAQGEPRQQGQKRRGEDTENASEEPMAPVSKRQAKKMRIGTQEEGPPAGK
ncbi:putative rnase p subunit p30 protein [Phialemonium atrogriseum]|uniref:Rnase p subunit p30 protein n=1 Tax=Phialemonium atrogriseum TaxID=1093897 RepID=A0AAJ0BZE1_9PEZI|nr:putative rnase p subunit p30 protein [Phialemonium atrogriseum]KAK1767110.1 putative rnase p subunit p30 protein [Phialemonium atrogriseum]